MITRTFKYRMYPTKQQQVMLNTSLEVCRWLYNTMLDVRKDSWEVNGISLSYIELQNMIPDLRQERPELQAVYAQALQNVVKRVDLAFDAFFRRVKAGETPGYPRFKGVGWYDSITYPQYSNGVKLNDKTLRVSKIGDIEVRLHRKLKGTPKTVTLTRSRTGKWYACIAVEIEEQPIQQLNDKVVGIDVGLTHFATLSDGTKIDNPRFFKLAKDALAKAQRNDKPKKIIARIHERIANQRNNFAHQLSRKLVNEYDLIAVEKLDIKDMMDGNYRSMNRGIADVAWEQFRQFIAYKAESAGKQYVEVNPRGTSQRCSNCQTIVKKDLSVRVHQCANCGLVLDRDHNAALNILALGLQCVRHRPVEAATFMVAE